MAEDFSARYVNANRAANAVAYDGAKFREWNGRLESAFQPCTQGLSAAALVSHVP
jgi:hypothetical protein